MIATQLESSKALGSETSTELHSTCQKQSVTSWRVASDCSAELGHTDRRLQVAAFHLRLRSLSLELERLQTPLKQILSALLTVLKLFVTKR